MGFLDVAARQLEIDEGRRRKLYKCTADKWSIGVGRNLEDRGLRDSEIDLMLENDIAEAAGIARKLFPSFDRLSDARKAALVNLAFNLGEPRLAGFKRFREALEAQAWDQAEAELLDSRWAGQVGERAKRIAKAIKEG